jgi:hypothetical protein
MQLVLGLFLIMTAALPDDRPCVVVVIGAAGTSEYQAQFARCADQWRVAARNASADLVQIGLETDNAASDRDRLATVLREKASDNGPLWLVLIGHGTFDGREAKFNLRGPDLTDLELNEWLKPLERPIAVIDCASASGPFISRLSAPGRVIVTATKSGNEQNYARFGQYFTEAVSDLSGDLDKDGQVSLLEAFLMGSHRVAEFYKTQSRLATEHALIDDNGDGLGTPADWFHGVRATRRAKDGSPLDGIRAHQFHLLPSPAEREMPADARQRRNELELAISELRNEKEKLGPDAYYARLEKLMNELARVYQGLERAPERRPPASPGR